MNQHTPIKNTASFLSLFSFFVLGVIVVISGYVGFQKYRLTNTVQQLQERIEIKQKTQKENSGGLEFNQFLNASQSLKKAETYRIVWSEIAQTILSYENPNIVFERFSSTANKEISVSGVSRSVNDVTILLEMLKKSPTVQAPFISAINKNVDNTVKFELIFSLITP